MTALLAAIVMTCAIGLVAVIFKAMEGPPYEGPDGKPVDDEGNP